MEFISEDEVRLIPKGYLEIAGKLSGEKWGRDEYRREMLLAAEGICVMAELSAKMAGYKVETTADAAAWLDKYRENWLADNKPGELYRIEEMFGYCLKQGG